MSKFLAIIVLTVSLTACAGPLGKPRDNRVMTSRETCISGCNRDSAVCGDEPSSSREALQGTGRLQNAGRQCDLNLGSCLDRCKAL